MAPPILTVDTRQRFLIRDRFLHRSQFKSLPADLDGRGRNYGAITGAAAPFAIRGTAKAATRNPAVMSKSD